MRRGRRIARLATAALLAGGCEPGYEEFRPPPPDPPRGVEVPVEHVAGGELAIAEPGVLVVRSHDEWRTLRLRYAHNPPRADPPADFRREMLAVVSYGPTSACTDRARHVWRVEKSPDTLFVVLAFGGYPGPIAEVTCAMVVEPVDVVRLPRTDAPVKFVGYTGEYRVPPPARWLDRYTAAETDTLPPELGRLHRVFLARDSTTPRSELRHLSETLLVDTNVPLLSALANNPAVVGDAELLAELAAMTGDSGSYRREAIAPVLLARHGRRLARERGTHPEVLRTLLWELDRTQGNDDVARLLIRHPTVLNDRQLLWDAYRYLVHKHITCAESDRLLERYYGKPRDARDPPCVPPVARP
ncbi:MAG: hypothetical protein KY444_09870 [Gemmatimonadetes bacterium]|nr:hypothetical protein [Gemmatimonadota bacterium]